MAHRPMQYQGDESRADGDEYQRMRELPVVFERQQRIGRGSDQDVEVGRHARDTTEERKGA